MLYDEEGVHVLSPVADAVTLPFTLAPVVMDLVIYIVPDTVATEEAEIDLLIRPVKEPRTETEAEEETLAVFVFVYEPDAVLLIGPVFVGTIERLPVTEAVDVLEDDMDRVIVAEDDADLVPCVEPVVVLEARVLPEPVTLAVEVLELVILREELGEDVLVLDELTLCVTVEETKAEPDALPVFVKEGEAEDVLDEASVLLCVTLAVPVFEEEADLEPLGLVDELLEEVIVPVPVRVGAVDRVLVVEPVIVFVITPLILPPADALAVLDAAADLVATKLCTLVNVFLADSVNKFVGRIDLVPVVVRVDVLDMVELAVGKTISPTKIRACSIIGGGGSPEDDALNRKNNKSCILRILLFYTYYNHLDATSSLHINSPGCPVESQSNTWPAALTHTDRPSLSSFFIEHLSSGSFSGAFSLSW